MANFIFLSTEDTFEETQLGGIVDLGYIGEILQETSELLNTSYGQVLEVKYKQDQSLVTDVDLKADQLIRKKILSRFQGHEIMTEEGDFHSTRQPGTPIWVIDPLDGTSNFAHGFPYFGVSIAFGQFKENNQIELQMAGIAQPTSGDLYTAEKGCGAYKNNVKIQMSDSAIKHPFVAVSDHQIGHGITHVPGWSFRKTGAVALDLALVAAGVFDGFIGLNLMPWDIAAGSLLITEAGGRMKELGAELEEFHIESNHAIGGTRNMLKSLHKEYKGLEGLAG